GNMDKQILEFDPEIEQTLCKLRKQGKLQKKPHEISSKEAFEEVLVNMVEEGDQRKTFGEFTVPTTASYGSRLVRPTVEANNFELKPALITSFSKISLVAMLLMIPTSTSPLFCIFVTQ
ncbi:hypothetical protein PIB30_101447, partial [Stylosanthes scabra]|nr:hypothetical protein [Stylosanthes scabra]